MAHASGTEECRSACFQLAPLPPLLDEWASSSGSVPRDGLHSMLGKKWGPSDLQHSLQPIRASRLQATGYRPQATGLQAEEQEEGKGQVWQANL